MSPKTENGTVNWEFGARPRKHWGSDTLASAVGIAQTRSLTRTSATTPSKPNLTMLCMLSSHLEEHGTAYSW